MSKRVNRVARVSVMMVLAALIAHPAVGASGGNAGKLSPRLTARLSGGPLTKYWVAHPDQAPAAIRPGIRAAAELAAQVREAAGTPAKSASTGSDVFNFDAYGLPQNEESVDVCRSKPKYVIGGTNDYRYVLDPEGNSTGWHFSTDGGTSLFAEGLLPHIDWNPGTPIASGGDPVSAFDEESCAVYAADLNYSFGDVFPRDYFPNGIGVYRSTPATLKSCPSGGSDPACWPEAVFAARSSGPQHFLDKEWMDVGTSGDAGKVVWVSWSDFFFPDPTDGSVFTASVWAARCDEMLTSCSDPIKISGDEPDIQFSDVTIGPDGRVYVTWVEVQGELEGLPETFVLKLRVADAGSTTFGPTQVVETITKPIGFDNTLYGQTFRVATAPKSTVKMVNGSPRIYATWEQCSNRTLGYCQNPSVWIAWSDDDGATWEKEKVSAGGDNYFPTIAADTGPRIAVAYYTSRYDSTFQLAQDVELVTVDAATLAVENRQRVTYPSNNPNADWFFSGGVFIGDYFEMAAYQGKAYIHTNLNYRPVEFLGGPPGKAEPQQDNYLFVRHL